MVLLWKKILLEGCSSAGMMNITVQAGELAGRNLLFPIHKPCITTAVPNQNVYKCFLFS